MLQHPRRAPERPHMRESRTYVFSDEHNCDHAYVRLADHDAALRRAKAEVLREVKYEALGSRIKCFKFDTLYAEGNDDALNALVKWLDARAAQIEEGE